MNDGCTAFELARWNFSRQKRPSRQIVTVESLACWATLIRTSRGKNSSYVDKYNLPCAQKKTWNSNPNQPSLSSTSRALKHFEFHICIEAYNLNFLPFEKELCLNCTNRLDTSLLTRNMLSSIKFSLLNPLISARASNPTECRKRVIVGEIEIKRGQVSLSLIFEPL